MGLCASVGTLGPISAFLRTDTTDLAHWPIEATIYVQEDFHRQHCGDTEWKVRRSLGR